jgi:hypothetical protein
MRIRTAYNNSTAILAQRTAYRVSFLISLSFLCQVRGSRPSRFKIIKIKPLAPVALK